MDPFQAFVAIVPSTAWFIARGGRRAGSAEGRPRTLAWVTTALLAPLVAVWSYFLVSFDVIGRGSPIERPAIYVLSLLPLAIVAAIDASATALRRPRRRPVAIGALAAMLVAAWLAASLWPSRGPAPDVRGPALPHEVWFSFGAPLLACAAPVLVGALAQRRAPAPTVGVVAALALAVALAVPSAPALLFAVLFDHNPAEHAWAATVRAPDGADYVVRVPFVLPGGERDEVRRRLAEEVRVVEGDARIDVDAAGGWITVHGTGDARVVARVLFFGTTADREAFHRFPSNRTTLERAPDATVVVEWTADFSGGSGHTCWAHARLRSVHDGVGEAALEPVGPYGDPLVPEDGAFRVAAICA